MCSSDLAYAGLSEAAHTFEVRIVDAAGNGTAAATRAFTVDTTAPTSTVTIDTKPTDPDNSPTPSFGLSGAAAGETYQCQIDTGAWVACTSPWTSAALAEGVHTFRARTADAAGNTGSATAYVWTLDTTPPAGVPTILSGPNDPSATATGTFAFSGAVGSET